MNYFDNFSQLRQNPSDVTRFPHRQLASKVFSMVGETYMKNWDHPVTLRSDVSPEMLEACFARVIGKDLMMEVVKRLPVLAEQFKDCDVDDMYLSLIEQKPLLAEFVEKSASGAMPALKGKRLSFFVYCLLGGPLNVNRFVLQAQQRIATVH